MDPRYIDLAEVLTGHSTQLEEGDRVLIDCFDIPAAMVIALIRTIRQRGALPHVTLHNARISREMLLGAKEEQFAFDAEIKLRQMKGMDAYIALRGAHNIFENSDVSADRVLVAESALKPVLDYRVRQTRWVVLRWPTPGMAQQALMSSEAFEDFYFRVCSMDYSRMTEGMENLKALMESTDRVRIVGKGTDLEFSIKGIPAVTCGGLRNIPDGEVFTSPVKNSVNGVIRFNAPTIYQGTSFDRIRLVFQEGRVVESSSTNSTRLEEILDTDDGARYIGEFSLAFNPHITRPMRDILFDEKMAGSFHFTPGQAYEEADNGNRSQIHWDMVCLQTPQYGGGEIYFDGDLIRKDGQFIPDPLQKLNPEYLLAEDAQRRAN